RGRLSVLTEATVAGGRGAMSALDEFIDVATVTNSRRMSNRASAFPGGLGVIKRGCGLGLGSGGVGRFEGRKIFAKGISQFGTVLLPIAPACWQCSSNS